jgi:hypothetical protein
MYKDGFGVDITLGCFLVYSAHSGMKIARVIKKTEELRYGKINTTLTVKVYGGKKSSYGGSSYVHVYNVALRSLKRTMVINDASVPAEIKSVLI